MSVAQPPKAPSRVNGRSRKIGLFGGSFDPIHVGHLAVARAAQRRFHLDHLLFVPSGRPPHKVRHHLAAFPHRFAMVALACDGHPRFVPSLAEAGPELGGHRVYYSIDTVRHFRHVFRRDGDHLYFILGADSFLKIPTWKEYVALLNSCDFIVASRPGFRSDVLRLVIPRELLGHPHPTAASADAHAIALRRTTVHLLESVASNVSSTEVRRRRHRGQSIRGLVPARVEEYIGKQALYR